MNERDIYGPLQAWMKKNLHHTAAIEVKIVKSAKFNLADFPAHQRQGLTLCATGTLSYKLPDTGWDRKPFDIFYMHKTKAYLVVCFYTARVKKRCYFISYEKIPESGTFSEEQVGEFSEFYCDI